LKKNVFFSTYGVSVTKLAKIHFDANCVSNSNHPAWEKSHMRGNCDDIPYGTNLKPNHPTWGKSLHLSAIIKQKAILLLSIPVQKNFTMIDKELLSIVEIL
jgi:hypothetical protein